MSSVTVEPRAESRVEPRVLLVDDEVRALAVAERALTSVDIACRLANSADEALTWLRGATQTDVVVSDIRMPVNDGIEFLTRLRDEFASRRWLQIILVTGHATVDTAIAAIRLEASDYLIKPVEPTALRESVGHALKRAESLRRVERAAPQSSDAAALREFADVASELAGNLRQMSRPGPVTAALTHAKANLATLELLRRLQGARQTIFGDAVMPEPAWEMLAELMRARLAGERLSVTSLALSSLSPATTALRRIEDLIQCGLATRTPDPADRRRSYVELTPEGAKRMQVFLEGFARTVLG
jgi:CheY-like chemotaxis protein/DNA-binding MarR family transcriptional regulator